jgi:hypothetical protein
MWQNIYSKNPEVVKRKIAGELILVPIGETIACEQKIYALNDVGEFIFDQLNGKTTLQKILQKLLKEFAVSKEQAEADILQFITEMSQHQLVCKVDAVIPLLARRPQKARA